METERPDEPRPAVGEIQQHQELVLAFHVFHRPGDRLETDLAAVAVQLIQAVMVLNQVQDDFLQRVILVGFDPQAAEQLPADGSSDGIMERGGDGHPFALELPAGRRDFPRVMDQGRQQQRQRPSFVESVDRGSVSGQMSTAISVWAHTVW